MIVSLKFHPDSIIYKNLIDAWIEATLVRSETWEEFLCSIPYVIDADRDWSFINYVIWENSCTVVTFASEEHKTWFILRWS